MTPCTLMSINFLSVAALGLALAFALRPMPAVPTSFEERGAIVAVLADWCGHCKAVKPVLESLMADPSLDVTLLDADSTSPQVQKIIEALDVKGYPSIFVAGKPYKGPRTAEAIKAAALA